jgi:hypothetical protein
MFNWRSSITGGVHCGNCTREMFFINFLNTIISYLYIIRIESLNSDGHAFL